MVRRICILLVVALVVAACFGDSSGTTSTTTNAATSTTGSETTSTTEGETSETTVAERTWTELPGIEDLPQEVQDELLELVGITEQIRQLTFIEPPMITIVTQQELNRRVAALLEEDTESFPADEALYKLLGLLPQDADLEELVNALYGEQVAGYYDPETDELVVPMREDGFSISQRGTMIHELTHALTDQHFDVDTSMNQLLDAEAFDQFSAFQGLLEGDATLTELYYLQTLSQGELGELMAEIFEIDTTVMDSLPTFLQDSFIFPYDSGLAFAQRLQSAGGWEAVNDAYTTMPDLPGSTEQIITPSDYRRDLPISVSLAPIDLPGYTLELQSVWGELGFRIMLDQVLGEDVGIKAADGWGGDMYYQWFDGQNAALVITYVGDTERDLLELEDALVDFAFASVPEEDYVWVEEVDGQLYFIAADDPEVGVSILASVKG